MKLLFEEITGKTQKYRLSGSSWLSQENEDFLCDATANISVSRRDGKTVFLEGDLKGTRQALCDRCGEPVKKPLHCLFVYLVTTGKDHALEQHDLECSDDAATILYLDEPEIDVDEILREQSYLAVPLRTLCREDCKGICAGCGVDLNSETCRCSVDKSQSPFAVLGKRTDN